MLYYIIQYVQLTERTCGLIVVDVDPLQLEVRIPVVGSGRVDAVLVRDHFPELKAAICSLVIVQ